MRPHRFVYHKSAAAIVREFFSDGKDYPMAPSTKLRKIRKQGMWGYTDVPDDPLAECTVHIWHYKDVPMLRVARLVSHELGHLGGLGPQSQDDAEEERADEYARVTVETLRFLSATGLL
jgi:hypothetical protein